MPRNSGLPKRRLNPDQQPFNRLPLISFEPAEGADPTAGIIHVIRGTIDVTTLSDQNRHELGWYPNKAHVVFTNRLGHHELKRSGGLVPIGIDYTRVAELPDRNQALPTKRGETLAEYAQRHRNHADDPFQNPEGCASHTPSVPDQSWFDFNPPECPDPDRLRAMAEQYDALHADGWVFNNAQHAFIWPLYDASPGPSYKVPPRRT